MEATHTFPPFIAAEGFSCENGSVRLLNGRSEYQGLVEVCVNNRYTSVCDDGSWGVNEATIVCRQLNYTSNGCKCQQD